MKLSAIFAPGPRTLEYALHAEALGYERVWVYDSPALYWDCFPCLAQLACHTTTVGLGVGTLVPDMRHPVTTVGAALAVDAMAPGRLALSVGTGFTGRRLLGKRPHTWAQVEAYTTTVRGLLAGDEIEVDGVPVRAMYPPGTTRIGEAAIPILVAANGPKGLDVATRVGDGVMSIAGPLGGFAWSAYAVQGTVLTDTEHYADPQVQDRVAAALALQYHVAYELGGPAVVDQLPGGDKWRMDIEQIPAGRRHLVLHEGHVTEPPPRERDLLHPDVTALTFTGVPDELRDRAAGFTGAGMTELIYTPLGPDIHRELRAMADALGVVRNKEE